MPLIGGSASGVVFEPIRKGKPFRSSSGHRPKTRSSLISQFSINFRLIAHHSSLITIH